MSGTTPTLAIPYASETDAITDYPATDHAAALAIETELLRPVRRATTIAGLGTVADGAIGKIRWGAVAPNVGVLPLVYDATLGKWVSEAKWARMPFGGNLTGVATWSIVSMLTMPFRPLDVAGLKPQLRWCGNIGPDFTGRTLYVNNGHLAIDLTRTSSIGLGEATQAGAYVARTDGQATVYDSGWVDLTPGYAVGDLIGACLLAAASAGGIYFYGTSHGIRWVSK
jgi:hypothetical protein